MVMEDKLVADTEDRKNALEEYIYELRGKLDDLYSKFASEDEKRRAKIPPKRSTSLRLRSFVLTLALSLNATSTKRKVNVKQS